MNLASQTARTWQVFGKSVRGASHVRSGAPNQDSIGWLPDPDRETTLLLAVADGHGSPRCPRSDQGARLAVDAAQSLIGELRRGRDPKWLAQELVHRWREHVERHLAETPFDGDRTDPFLAYGTTILAASVSPQSAVFLQLGDGDILTVSANGSVSRLWKPRFLGNETPSLASPDAASEIRIQEISDPEELPELILLSTDGYANSFREDNGFLAVGADILGMLRAEGMAPIQENLETWLREASEFGSGDDVTVGILWRETPPARSYGE